MSDEEGDEIQPENEEPVRYYVPTPAEKRKYLKRMAVGVAMIVVGVALALVLLGVI